MKKRYASLLCLVFALGLSAQSTEPVAKLGDSDLTIHLKRSTEKIVIDGHLMEEVWQKGDNAANFWQYFPYDTSSAQGQTEIRMTYDDQFLYVGVRCHSAGPDYVVQSLRRDYSFSGNDNITLLFDTFNDKTNAFVFGMNPMGVRREALISGGGRTRGGSSFSSSWDNKWYGTAKIKGDYWEAEFAIPFKTLRFQEGSTEWRFNCYRRDTQINELSSWVQIPRNYIIMDLSFMGRIIWDEPLKKPGANISVIPYLTAGMNRDFEDPEQTNPNWPRNAGGDAKIALTSGLNLDLTVNPDFSQVEVDQQVTDLSRFELFFPERRQFFLENADLFGSFGLTRVNPFFSRRIGVARDTATGQNIQNSILYGARLSGKVNEDLRVGLLNMQTARQDKNGLPGFNYTVATLEQQVFDRSNVSFIFVNKQAVNGDPDADAYNLYNRVAGLEYRLASKDTKWTGKTFLHLAFTPDEVDHKFTHGFQLELLERRYRLEWAHLFVGQGYNAEVGFVPRKDYMLMSPEVQFLFFPKKGVVNQHSINIDSRFFLQVGKDGNTIIPDWGLSERQIEAEWEIRFANNTQAGLTLMEDELTLLRDFDPTRLQVDGVFLPAGSSYHFFSMEASYESDQRKKFFYEIGPNFGEFYSGIRAGLSGTFTYRYQPFGSIAVDFDYNYIKLADPFKPVNIWLVGPRVDLTFSKNLFLTTFVQYNNQLDNLNINTRFQWRFQPVSDFFLVYTDNYITDPFSQFSVRNRAIVAKLTYWLNL
ncbi:MAG: carbohydrate binding family 9 domain-containing protein [Saprospiraceae bacterium]|nr:carbohydrate binding family 9 domain-containing protein [Saprospiraceae bacterium]